MKIKITFMAKLSGSGLTRKNTSNYITKNPSRGHDFLQWHTNKKSADTKQLLA